VVIAIIAILIGMLLPAVQKVREAANRSRAEEGCMEIAAAMGSFFDAHGRLPVELRELSGIIDENLALGAKDGYSFAFEPLDDQRARIVCSPVAPGITGSETVSLVAVMTPRGTGEPSVMPTAGADEAREAMFADLYEAGARAADDVLAADQSGGTAAGVMTYLCDPANIVKAFNDLDQNDDGLVAPADILSLQLGRDFPRLVPFLDDLRELMQLGVANEDTTTLPGSPIDDPSSLCSFSFHLSFRRGDCDGDGQITGVVTDAVVLLSFNFLGATAPPCLAACDANGDGEVTGTVTDAVYLLSYNFLGGPPPPAPFPGCGAGKPSDLSLGCASPPESCGS
jgi:type II secretory pathway pseudopilin PulG